jgi:hypothetical protein
MHARMGTESEPVPNILIIILSVGLRRQRDLGLTHLLPPSVIVELQWIGEGIGGWHQADVQKRAVDADARLDAICDLSTRSGDPF